MKTYEVYLRGRDYPLRVEADRCTPSRMVDGTGLGCLFYRGEEVVLDVSPTDYVAAHVVGVTEGDLAECCKRGVKEALSGKVFTFADDGSGVTVADKPRADESAWVTAEDVHAAELISDRVARTRKTFPEADESAALQASAALRVAGTARRILDDTVALMDDLARNGTVTVACVERISRLTERARELRALAKTYPDDEDDDGAAGVPVNA